MGVKERGSRVEVSFKVNKVVLGELQVNIK